MLTDLRDRTLPDRFWAKVEIGHPAECWPYIGDRNQHGYGRFCLRNTPRIREYGHRMAYLLTHAVDVTEHVIMHVCDNPPCCNPAHLRLGTQLDNVADMIAKGRNVLPPGCRKRSA